MIAGFLTFNTLPEIGFAHNHYSGNYVYHYGRSKFNFEIVYINSGSVSLEYQGKEFIADEGSILILFRHLPVKVSTLGHAHQSHCTIQIGLGYDFLISDTQNPHPDNGLLLPFVLPDQYVTAEIIKELNDIVSLVSQTPGRYSFNASLRVLGVLEKIDRIARNTSNPVSPAHLKIATAVSYYVDENISQKISLKNLSEFLKKSPNYINHAFRNVHGKSITEYINEKKVKHISALMQKDNIPFPHACEMTGIGDISYGYRLFKKHTGLTPSTFMKNEKIIK